MLMCALHPPQGEGEVEEGVYSSDDDDDGRTESDDEAMGGDDEEAVLQV